jgi:thiamine pyrophosphate-dependent acetolactate synthase large subunit-like protein
MAGSRSGDAAVTSRPGRAALLEQLVADGFDHMFGNPGTVEQGFLDELRGRPELRYVLALHETIAVLCADGYARASGRPALVQIHSTPGLGNAIGALYQAKRGHSPLVVIGGDAGIRYQAMEAQMAGDLVAMAEPVTKWSAMVQDPSSLLRMVRRAVKVAMTPPMGPVYLCLPADVLDAPNDEPVFPTTIPSTRVIPTDDVIAALADELAGAERPMLYVGDGVAFSGAHAAVARIAELVGAQVWDVDAGEVNCDQSHPCYQGATGHMFASHSAPILRHGDVNLIVGTYIVPEVFPELGDVWAPGARVLHVDLDTSAIARNHRVDIGVVADPRLTLELVAIRLGQILGDDRRNVTARRVAEMAAERARRLDAERAADDRTRGSTPLHPAEFVEELARQLPSDAVIVDEALTSSPAIARYRPGTEPGSCHLTRGGSLGIGIPGAIGAKLARPDRTVVGLTGDGGSMYTIQALWTAARHGIDAKFVVCNNRSYRLLQANITQWWTENGVERHDFPECFDLSEPPIRFDDLAQSMGVMGVRVDKSEQIRPAIADALAHPGPALIELVIEGDVRPEHVAVRCGQ